MEEKYLKMKKLNNKGFTIVELVIVVAVIAILAAVLIPTISSLIKTAQTSADVTLVKNVNLFLATERALEGKNATMQDALDDALEGGYDITKLTPTNSDNLILWDQESDNFVLFANGKYNNAGAEVAVDEADPYKLWNISDTTEGSKYSVYYTGNATEVTVNGVGFDAGNSNVATVNYENTTGTAKNVDICTNGGALNVKAATDTVNHYGEVNEVYIEEIADASYHEFGKAIFIKVQKGRVEVETSATIGGIYVTSDDARVTNESGATLPTVTNSDEISEADAKEAAVNAVPPAGVARIDLKGYATLQDAINAANSGEVVILTNNIALTQTISVTGDDNIILNLNGKSIAANGINAINNFGSLKIVGDGSIVSSETAIYSETNGILEIDNGYVEGACAVYLRKGNAVINNGEFVGNKSSASVSGKEATIKVMSSNGYDISLTINDGIFTTAVGSADELRTLDVANSFATVTINGGEFKANRNNINGNIYYDTQKTVNGVYVGFVINGGTFDCDLNTNYKYLINDGIFNGTLHILPTSNNDSNPVITINGGIFNKTSAPFSHGINNTVAYMAIYGGEFKANTPAKTSGVAFWEKEGTGSNCKFIARVYGGTFAADPSQTDTNKLGVSWSLSADAYHTVENADGTWTVVAN